MDDFDRVLGEVMNRYAGEPPADLNRRILRRAGWFRSWWVGVAASIAAAVAAVWWTPHVERLELRVSGPAAPAVAAANPVRPPTTRPRAVRRPEVFPTPRPVTAEESALLRLAAIDNVFLPTLGEGEIEPVVVPEVKIEPIGETNE